mgnify:CR=1 FL=1
MLSVAFRRIVIGLGLFALAFMPALAHASDPVSAPAPRRPAVLFTGGFEYGCNHVLAARLERDGFNVNYKGYPALDGAPLTWDEIKQYNVLVISGLALANADGTLTSKNKSNIALLRRFMQEGGGIFYVPCYVERDTQLPAQIAFLKPLGLTPLFDELPYDPDTFEVATAWKIPFAYTRNIAADSPVSEGVTGLWYPQITHIGAQMHTTPLKIDSDWTAWVRGGKSAGTLVIPHRVWPVVLDEAKKAKPGSYASEPVLMAGRSVGKGRLVVFSISPKYILGTGADHTGRRGV